MVIRGRKKSNILKEIPNSVENFVKNSQDVDWHACLERLLQSARNESINYKSVDFNGLGLGIGLAGDNRLLFMPHSPGIYIALILKDPETLLSD